MKKQRQKDYQVSYYFWSAKENQMYIPKPTKHLRWSFFILDVWLGSEYTSGNNCNNLTPRIKTLQQCILEISLTKKYEYFKLFLHLKKFSFLNFSRSP